MEIVRIFDNCLFAIKYDDEEVDEFERLFELWNDIEYLEDFFESNKTDLQCEFWGGISIDDAIGKTFNYAENLEKILVDLSEKSTDEQNEGLESLFEPLNISQFRKNDLEKSKAKESWLRIYALRIKTNAYIITGGAIKLTSKMQERKHTNIELQKLDKCRKFLLAKGISDIDGVIEEIEI